MYRFANKYGANVDGYSPIYTPEVWSETGSEYKLGTKGLLAWCAVRLSLSACPGYYAAKMCKWSLQCICHQSHTTCIGWDLSRCRTCCLTQSPRLSTLCHSGCAVYLFSVLCASCHLVCCWCVVQMQSACMQGWFGDCAPWRWPQLGHLHLRPGLLERETASILWPTTRGVSWRVSYSETWMLVHGDWQRAGGCTLCSSATSLC